MKTAGETKIDLTALQQRFDYACDKYFELIDKIKQEQENQSNIHKILMMETEKDYYSSEMLFCSHWIETFKGVIK